MSGNKPGRRGLNGSAYRRARANVLARSDLCALCGHGGAETADHIITARDWPRDADGRHLPGLDAEENLQPAHGTKGSRLNGTLNRCPTCGRLCNQSRGARTTLPPHSPRSQVW